MDLTLRGYDFIVFEGIDKNGNPYRTIQLTKDLSWNDMFISDAVRCGAKVINVGDKEK